MIVDVSLTGGLVVRDIGIFGCTYVPLMRCLLARVMSEYGRGRAIQSHASTTLTQRSSFYCSPSGPTVRIEQSLFMIYRCLLLTRMYCCVGDSLRSHPSHRKHRKNCGKEMILDNIIMANIE